MARVTLRARAPRPYSPGHVYGRSRTGALICGPGRQYPRRTVWSGTWPRYSAADSVAGSLGSTHRSATRSTPAPTPTSTGRSLTQPWPPRHGRRGRRDHLRLAGGGCGVRSYAAPRCLGSGPVTFLEFLQPRGASKNAELRAHRDSHASLTPRERETMALVVSGLLNKQIAAKLGISEITGEGPPRPGYAEDASRSPHRTGESRCSTRRASGRAPGRGPPIPRYRPTPSCNRSRPAARLSLIASSRSRRIRATKRQVQARCLKIPATASGMHVVRMASW